MRRLAALLVPVLALAVPLGAQAPADTAAAPGVSPGGAFLRSLVLPGWGHAEVGSYTRGGFYFLSSAAIGGMLFKTGVYLRTARQRRNLVEADAEARFRREGVVDPDSLAALVEADPRVQDHRGLVEARSEQMEDWLALGIFWLLLNGADAFVAAHLADFPEPVEVEARPVGPPGRMEIGVSIPVGPGRP